MPFVALSRTTLSATVIVYWAPAALREARMPACPFWNTSLPRTTVPPSWTSMPCHALAWTRLPSMRQPSLDAWTRMPTEALPTISSSTIVMRSESAPEGATMPW